MFDNLRFWCSHHDIEIDESKLSYNYLISYSFMKKPIVDFGKEHRDSGAGRMVLTLKQKITMQSLNSVEILILEELKKTIDDIESVSLYSFSLLET